MKYILVCAISFLLLQNNQGHTSVPKNAFMEFFRIHDYYSHIDYLKFNGAMIIRDSASKTVSSTVIRNFSFSNGRYSYKEDSLDVIQGFMFNVWIDKNLHVIDVSNKDAFIGLFQVPLLDHDFRKANIAGFSFQQLSENSASIRFTFLPASVYSTYEVVYNPKTLQISSLKLGRKASSNKISETVLTVSEMNLAPFDAQFFDEYTYLMNAGEGFTTTSAYQGFRILNATTKD